MTVVTTPSSTGGLPPGFERFSFVAEALDASGGFAPKVVYSPDESGLVKPASVSGRCHLVPYPRESMKKFAARAAVAVYENHLASACERFVGYLNKSPPVRDGVDGPLTTTFLQDADWCGNALDVFWGSFMVQARARGTMLLLVDMPQEIPPTEAEQVAKRAVPYLTAIAPERVRQYQLDSHGRFSQIAIEAVEKVDGEPKAVLREWDAQGWRVRDGEKILQQGTHGFGRCPVIAFTESGSFPCFGTFEQIAQLSRRHFNAQSELDEILRSQTFSLLTYQVPGDEMSAFNADQVAGVIGTHNMLIHSGQSPEFIAPGDGPATVYIQRIEKLEAAIRRIGMVIEDTTQQAADSGLALQIRFQSLNAALASFAMRMQDLERQMWDLVFAGLRLKSRAKVAWPLDYTVSDARTELDVLTAMQSTGFPERVLIEKRKQIAAVEFSSADQELMTELLDSIDEPSKEPSPTPPKDPNAPDPGTDPNNPDPQV